MTGVARFTVSVPAGLLKAVDRKLVRGGQRRSEVVRRLLEEALREAEEQEDIQRYIRGYRDSPQTEEEFGWSDQVTRERLAGMR